MARLYRAALELYEVNREARSCSTGSYVEVDGFDVPVWLSRRSLTHCGIGMLVNPSGMVHSPADPKGWFVTTGRSGAGKTHLCTAICGELLHRGLPVRYMLVASSIPIMSLRLISELISVILHESLYRALMSSKARLISPTVGLAAPPLPRPNKSQRRRPETVCGFPFLWRTIKMEILKKQIFDASELADIREVSVDPSLHGQKGRPVEQDAAVTVVHLL